MNTKPILGNRQFFAVSGLILTAVLVAGCAPATISSPSVPEANTPTPTPTATVQTTFSMSELNVGALKTALTNARAALAHPTGPAMVAEAVNTVVSLAGDTVKPKLTTQEWTNIAVPNYQLQIDSGNGKGLAAILPAAQDIIVKVERAGKNAGLL
ncbi:hypothetical protein ABIB49_003418 [Arthrobacter sp. UYCu512]|uniref:hypothetical protein n=1 Tax=Arthrobacter sp. UYCu512 TaxID=3156338 RepID=UPI00339A631D